MAAPNKRLNPMRAQQVRDHIQCQKLVDRLQLEALGEIEMTDGQRDSAKFLVNKCIGNAPQEQILSGNPDAPLLPGVIEFRIVDPKSHDG